MWIPRVMIVDDHEEILQSFVPSLLEHLPQALANDDRVTAALGRWDDKQEMSVRYEAHGFEVAGDTRYKPPLPSHVHVDLVRVSGGDFDRAIKLLNEQLFAAVLSDLRFDDARDPERRGQQFIDEMMDSHPYPEYLLYSVRASGQRIFQRNDSCAKRLLAKGSPRLAARIVKAIADHHDRPAIKRLVENLNNLNIQYQSDAFSKAITQTFRSAPALETGADRPLQCVGFRGRPAPVKTS